MTATLSLCRHKRTSPMAEEFPSNRRASTDEGRKSSWPRTAQNLAELFGVNHGRDSSMPKLKLTYFDFHGGRGEPARLALSIAGIPFEDDRVAGTDWPRRKPSTPFGSVPVLEVDGAIVTQSNGINRYVGKLADLYPSDAWHAALCDEAMDAVEDITLKVVATFDLPEAEKKAARQALVEG